MNAVVFLNDHEPDMNVVANTEKEIREWIETLFDCKWRDVKDIEDVTFFCKDMEDDEIAAMQVEFTDLRTAKA